MIKQQLLIIGKQPPPPGGVGVHIVRLLAALKTENISYSFYDLSNLGLSIFREINKSRIIHLHTSNVFLRLLLVIFCKISCNVLLFTYHGDILRQNKFKKILDKISIKLCYIPIMINKRSYNIAASLNTKAVLIPAFIPPTISNMLSKDLVNKIHNFRKSHDTIYCTNAYSLSYDKNGDEIYGILKLLQYFSENPKKGLIFSDTTGSYLEYFERNSMVVSSNVMIINELHDFVEIIKLSDAFIRNTTTDGDSLSLKEALYYRKTVYATDVVDRPEGVILYNNIESLSKVIEPGIFQRNSFAVPINGFEGLLKIYKSILES